VGTGTGIAALLTKHRLDEDGCTGTVCPPAQRNDVRAYNALRIASTTGFVIGGLGALAGGLTLLVRPQKNQPEHPAVAAWITADSAGVQGTF
jgi:hypothetical protein